MESKSRASSTKSTQSRKSLNLSLRRKIRQSNNDNVETRPNTRSDRGQIKMLLENLDIRFVQCTFTYKQSHFDDQATTSRRHSKLAAWRDKIFSSFEKVRETMSYDKTFDKCLFVPIDEKDTVKDFLLTNFPEVKLSFEDCTFIKRSSNLTEKLRIRLRKMFGIQFELEYITATAIVNDYTFRIKDILFVNRHIQERIVEDA